MTPTKNPLGWASGEELSHEAMHAHMQAELIKRFPGELRSRKPVFHVRGNRMHITMDRIAGTHYEVCYRRDYHEFAIHFQSTESLSLARRQAFDPYIAELTQKMGCRVRSGALENRGWMRVWVQLDPGLITAQKAAQYNDLFARFIELTWPVVLENKELFEGGSGLTSYRPPQPAKTGGPQVKQERYSSPAVDGPAETLPELPEKRPDRVGNVGTSPVDRPRCLKYEIEKLERVALLTQPHMQPLTTFVNKIRKDRRLVEAVPNFDPCDGGVFARVLFLAEAPGPKAVSSGFVSRNNDDTTAENTLNLLHRAGFERKDTVLWNIVPWYLGDGGRIRPAAAGDIAEGVRYLEELLVLLKGLQAIVLLGAKARQGFEMYHKPVQMKVFHAMHPSPQNLNTRPDAEGKILEVLRRAVNSLK